MNTNSIFFQTYPKKKPLVSSLRATICWEKCTWKFPKPFFSCQSVLETKSLGTEGCLQVVKVAQVAQLA
jgi:hypothetical protein